MLTVLAVGASEKPSGISIRGAGGLGFDEDAVLPGNLESMVRMYIEALAG